MATLAGAGALIPFNWGAHLAATTEYTNDLVRNQDAQKPLLLKAGDAIQFLSKVALVAFAIALIVTPAFSFMIIPFAIAVASSMALIALTLTAYAIYNRNNSATNLAVIGFIVASVLTAGLVVGLVFAAPIAVPIIIAASAGLGAYCIGSSATYAGSSWLCGNKEPLKCVNQYLNQSLFHAEENAAKGIRDARAALAIVARGDENRATVEEVEGDEDEYDEDPVDET